MGEDAPHPHERANARHLIVFTAFAGVIEGGIIAYLPVMLARMGASATTVSMLNSGVALAIIATSLPSGPLIARQRNLVPFVSWWILAIRLIFLVIAFAPFLDTWWVPVLIVVLWSLHGIPAAIVNNGIFGVLAEAVSARSRPRLNGIRWGLYGLAAAAVTGIFGYALDLLPFPLGYQVIFALSAIAGAAGVIAFRKIVIVEAAIVAEPMSGAEPPASAEVVASTSRVPIVETAPLAKPADGSPEVSALKRIPSVETSTVAKLNTDRLAWRVLNLLWPRQIGRDFVEFQVLTTILRLGINVPIGLFSLYWVNELHATDTWIGIRSTVAMVGLVVGYFGWSWISARIGARWTLGISSAGLSLFPGLTAIGPSVEWMLPAALAWGVFVAGVDFALIEGLLRACPRDRRAELVGVHQFQAHIVLFAAPLLGAWLADLTSIRTVMVIAVVVHIVVLAIVASMRSTYTARAVS